MTRPVILAALVLCVTICSGAQQQAAQNPAATTVQQERMETQLAKTVVFISLQVVKDGHPAVGHGTGFLVSVPDERLGKGNGFGYLVTNRHVAEAIDSEEGRCTKYEITEMHISLNLKVPVAGKRWDDVGVPLSGPVRWHFPTDEGIDLAVIPYVPDQKYDFKIVPIDDFITPALLEQHYVVQGDKVLFSGFFNQFAGMKGIQPIIREGILAMLPDGPMTTTLCKPGMVYLADAHSTPGNSGSPIFITPAMSLGGIVAINGSVPYPLLGVVSGYMHEDQSLMLTATTTWAGTLHGNSGIAMVVPAEQLRALLFSPELQKLRDDAVASKTAAAH